MDSFEISTDAYDPTTLSRNRRDTSAKNADKQPSTQSSPRARHAEKPNTSKNEAKTSTSSSGVMRLLYDDRLSIFIGIVITLFAAYLLIVSISYFSHGAEDQSIVYGHDLSEITAANKPIGNTGGPLGAFLSQILISQWLGLGSFVMIFYIGTIGLALVKMVKIRFWSLTFKSLLSAITVSIFVGFITYGMASHAYWGGEHGYYINNLLIATSGIWGAIGVNVILVSAVVLIFLSQIRHMYRIFSKRIVDYRQRLQNERNAARQRNQKTESMATPVMEPRRAKAEDETIKHEKTTVVNAPVEPKATVTPTQYHVEDKPADTQPIVEALTIEDKYDDLSTFEHDNGDDSEVKMIVNTPTIDTVDESEISNDVYDPTAELSRFKFPPLDLLRDRPSHNGTVDLEELESNKQKFTKMLNTYGIEISHIEATVGPTITLYEVIPAEGVRVNKIKSLEDDIALKLSALGIRIIAPMPGKGTIGIEVPNKESQTVSIRSILSSKTYQETTAELPMAMGATISNEVYLADLCKMPHLLVAGATGMGKSVGLNTIIASLLYKKHPAELKFVLVDPKMVEFSLYSKLERHYLAKLPDEEDAIITDMSKVVPTLNSLCVEMDNRYNLLKEAGVRDLKSYNQRFISRKLNPEKHRYLPYIVVIIDEFADLIMTSGKEVENPIARIAQKARAVGIHMILATQRPSTNVITGVIKANFPGRVAFRVTQMVDSRTIIDRPGANQLIGRGDMLFSRDGIIDRVQCAFIDTDEVTAICQYIADQIGYESAYELPEFVPNSAEGAITGGNVTDRDPLFESAGFTVIDSGMGSASNLQRKYNIGYPRAGKIMDQLEAAGVVGPSQGGKPRQVLMDRLSFERYLEMR